MFEYRPVPKPPKKEKKPYKGLQTKKPLQAKTELKAKSILKAKPKIVDKRIPQKKKKRDPKPLNELKVFGGTPIPSKATRGEFTDRDREMINKIFGAKCAECGNPYIEHHHAKFRSGSGRGVFRNGVPLCINHHKLCHESRIYADEWRAFLENLYGEYYFMDKWDLWLMGKIEDPNDKDYEAFMLEEQKRRMMDNE